MSLSLKHIPCPAGNNCTAFHCIFGHESDQPPAAPAPAVQEAKPQPRFQDDPSGNQDVPRKRAKTSSVTTSHSEVKTQKLDKGVAASAAIVSSTSARLQSATRPVSPPSLKRKAPSSDRPRAAPSTASSTLTQGRSSSGAQSLSSTAAKASQQKPKKPESLNPRLLKSSPASHEIRLRLLKMLCQEFTRLNKELKKEAKGTETALILTDQDLIVRALDEEQQTAVQKPAVYSNVMKNMVMQYKRMKVDQWKTERKEELRKKQAQDDGSEPPPKEIETGLTSIQEVQLTKRILTPIDKLSEFGYVPTVPNDEAIEKARQGVEASKGWEKCDRCQQRFQVFPGRREEDGALTSGGSCTFHWGKTFIAPKALGDRARQPKRYQCCGEEMGDSVGCFTQNYHVYKTSDPKRLASVLNFAETPENPLAPADRAVCFDCEMGYTVHGMELVRLTATSWPTGEVLLDVLVRPIGEILDLNSRYSGVWPEDLAQAEPWSVDDRPSAAKGSGGGIAKSAKKKLKIVSSPEVARDLLFSLISPKTPLIGHGLENDLNSVRIVHPTIIDTILLYPHKAGLPFRQGLKHLMNDQLNRKIQQETGPKMLGHDSAEDARAAGDLVRLKIKHLWMDMQRAGWRLVKGEFIAPGQSAGKGALTEEFIEK